MWNSSKYGDFYDKNKDSKISEYAFQAFFDILTLNIMSLEYTQTELINKILSSFGSSEVLPYGKEYSSDAKLSTETEDLELWLTTGYNSYRIKNLIIHLNTIFESYLHNFSKLWLERRQNILDNRTVSLKEVREKNKTDIFTEEMAKYIQDLLFGDYPKVFKRMKERINADFQIQPSKLKKLNEFYEIRNILVHSNGIISNKLVEINPEKNYKTGTHIYLDTQYVEDSEFLIVELLFHIDEYLLKNFPEIGTKNLSEFNSISVHCYYT